MKRLLALFLISGSCVGQDYLNQYTSHAEMLKQLKQLGVKTQQIGTSRSGKSIIAAQFGDKSSPAVLVTGNIDGDYLVGTELAMRLIEDHESMHLHQSFYTTHLYKNIIHISVFLHQHL